MVRAALPVLLSALLLVTGCAGPGDGGGAAPEEAEMKVTSPAFGEGGTVPVKYTCEGEDVSPPLNWEGVPEGTESLVLIVDDPDAPGETFTHWVLYDVSPARSGLDEAESVGSSGVNDFDDQGYGGPCPPPGAPHRYRFKVYALDTELGLGPGATKGGVLDAADGHILDRGSLTGKFSR